MTRSSRSAVARYAGTATAARIGDAGGGIGILLLAVDRSGAGTGSLIGGLLAAALTAPHALGPWTGRLLDRARDRRRVLGAACVLYGVALAAGALLLHGGWPAWSALGFAAAGAAGPLLTGGFSSLVSGLGGAVARVRGIDAVTYGVAGTAGPAVVAALATAVSPLVSLLSVAALVVLAGATVVALPVARSAAVTPAEPTGPREPWLLLRSRPLRQVTVTTIAAAAAGGALGVAAVLLAGELTGRTSGGGWFVAVLGFGNLIGALGVVWRPLQGEPVRQSLVLVAALAVATAAVAVVWSFAVGLAAFALVGLLTAPWVTATLNARERYAPPGRRGEVFVALAGVKVAGTSAGTALAGVLSGWGGRPLALAGGGLVLVAVLAVRWPTRRAAERRPAPG